MNKRITPPDVTSMTIEERDSFGVLITVERGNGDSVQVMTLTTQEWKSLQTMLETFSQGQSPAVHLTFKAIKVVRNPDATAQ